MDVSVFLEPKVDLEKLASILDGLGHEGRVHAIGTWNKPRMAAIFEAAKGQPITLDYVVPPSVGARVEVIHDLKNTLPLFTHAQKRFCRLEGEERKVGGYNHQTGIASITGPGYFTVSEGEGEHENELAVDYTRVPRSKPDSWPELEENKGPINTLVWGGMIDYLRKVSEHVSIGKATKDGKDINQYFALVRKDPG